MYADKENNFESNLFTFNCSNVNESVLHFCDTAVSDEKSNNKLFTFSPISEILTSNPSNSTALGSHEGEVETPHVDYGLWNLERGISEVLMTAESPQPKVDNCFTPEYMPVKRERAFVYDTQVFSTTASTVSPHETSEEVSKYDSSEGSDYNGNGNGMEVEIEEKTKPDQSKYKNKLKELFEKALKMYNDIKTLSQADYMNIVRENMKSDGQWAMEGENLEQTLRRFEILACSENKKEKAGLKKTLTKQLEAKQYCRFTELYGLIGQIAPLESEVIQNFNKGFKSKISHSFFKKNEFDSEDLFNWMLLTQIALVLLPEDPEYIELLPLKKSTVCLATWLIESPMKQENKDLYRDSAVRTHLREVMTEIYTNLMNQATFKMDQGRFTLLQSITEALGTNFALMQRGPRRVVKAGRARASPQYSEFDDSLTGKRGSSRAPRLSEDVSTKKVNKQRK